MAYPKTPPADDETAAYDVACKTPQIWDRDAKTCIDDPDATETCTTKLVCTHTKVTEPSDDEEVDGARHEDVKYTSTYSCRDGSLISKEKTSFSVCDYTTTHNVPESADDDNNYITIYNTVVTDCHDHIVSKTETSRKTVPKTKKPCKGDPVANPTIAPYGTSIKSGRNGNTRKYTTGRIKYHDGLDIASPINSDFYSMYPGKVVGLYKDCHGYEEGSYGNYVIIESTLPDGETIYIKYNHLNKVNVELDQIVDTDYILGQTGNTGNAFNDTNVTPHIHIQVRPTNDFSKGSFRKYDPNDIDPEKYLRTKFDANGKPVNPC